MGNNKTNISKKKLFSILTIICIASVLLIPIGLALMWFYTDWKKKLKIILTSSLSLLYIALILFMLLFEPGKKKDTALELPITTEQQNQEQITSSGKETIQPPPEQNEQSKKKGKNKKDSQEKEKLPSTLQKNPKGRYSRLLLSILFFLLMLFLIIWQNIRRKDKKAYENPYVDTEKYKLPLNNDSKMPLVHFLRLRINPNEQIYFATQTTQKDNEGDFIITNQRVVILSPEQNIEFPIHVLTAATSITDTVMQLISGDRKYFIFMHESQMKYALAVLKWTAAKYYQNKAKTT
ncbi:MAG: hypothetical protein K6G09_05145 [Treponema sp.]|nr:hypothetical protein [Treponema sp.]